MDNEHGELALELETLPDTDSEELGALIQRLRGSCSTSASTVSSSHGGRDAGGRCGGWSCSRSAARWSSSSCSRRC
jgi:hypothetical protein